MVHAQRRRQIRGRRIAEQQMRLRPVEDLRLASRRMAGIERQVSRAGLLDAQHAHQQPLIPGQTEGNHRLGAHALGQ
jgi:hypothetical protein